jgi:hypothetical protein
MKKLQTILLSISLLLSLLITSNVYSNNEVKLENTSNQLFTIKNGNLYIQVIDSFIEKNKDNTDKLKNILAKLVVIHKKLENKSDKKSEILKSILNYLDIKLSIALSNKLVEEALDEIKLEEIIITNDNSHQSITYPGFEDTYSEYDKTILA